jgi:PBP1b-binding outer membrane lipoprotein LpoB
MIMKRLALLAVTVFLAVLLFACGDKAEKKVEDNATIAEQARPVTSTTTPSDANKPADQSSE